MKQNMYLDPERMFAERNIFGMAWNVEWDIFWRNLAFKKADKLRCWDSMWDEIMMIVRKKIYWDEKKFSTKFKSNTQHCNLKLNKF